MASRATVGLIEAGNLHLEYGISLKIVGNPGMSEKGEESSLKGAEASLDFAFCLGSWSDEMSDIQSS